MFGDPTFAGWFTVAAYFFASVSAARAARSLSARGVEGAHPRRQAFFWGATAVGLLALGFNEQLDLQTLIINRSKAVVRGLGLLPEYRHQLLLAGVVAVGVIVVGSLLCLAWLLVGQWRAHLIALGGWCAILLYILLRAATFNHLQEELSWGFLAWGGIAFVEWLGIGLLAAAAISVRRRLARQHVAPTTA